jgi:hypothetical protein
MNYKEAGKPHSSCTKYLIPIGRKQVENAFPDIIKYLAKKIHTITASRFLIKLNMFIWALTLDELCKL